MSETDELKYRLDKALSELGRSTGRDRSTEAANLVSEAISSRHEVGWWGSSDDPALRASLTAQMIESLNRINRPGYYWRRDVRPLAEPFPSGEMFDAVNWLLREQNEEGDWPEDIWDTCEVTRCLLSVGVAEDSPEISKALDYLRDQVDKDWPDRESFWFGPGCLGAALTLFSQVNDERYLDVVLSQLFEMHDSTEGCFRHPTLQPGAVAPPEWHTACAIMGLYSLGSVPPRPDLTAAAFDWLLEHQNEDGSWGSGNKQVVSYTTRQCVIAASFEHRGAHHASLGSEWFLTDWRRARRGSASRTTLLGGTAALARTHRGDLYGSVNFLVLQEVESLLLQLESERSQLLTDLRSRVDDRPRLQELERLLDQEQRESESLLASNQHLAATIDGYAVKLKGSHLALVSLVIGLVSVIMPLTLVLLTS